MEKLCIGNIYSTAEVNGSFIVPQTDVSSAESCSVVCETGREGRGVLGIVERETGSVGVRDISQCKGWEKDRRVFCGKADVSTKISPP